MYSVSARQNEEIIRALNEVPEEVDTLVHDEPVGQPSHGEVLATMIWHLRASGQKETTDRASDMQEKEFYIRQVQPDELRKG